MAQYAQDLVGTSIASRHVYVFRLDNIILPSTGLYAVTVWGQGGHTYEIAAISWLHKLAGPPEAQNTSSGTSTAPLTGSVTGSAGDLYVAGMIDDSALNPETITFNSTANYTQEFVDTNASARFGTAYADGVIAGGGASTASWTLGDSVGWGTASGCYLSDGSTITKDQATTLTQVGTGDHATATFTTNPLPGSSVIVYVVTGNIGLVLVGDNVSASPFPAFPIYRLIRPNSNISSPVIVPIVKTGRTSRWAARHPSYVASTVQFFQQALDSTLSFTGPTNLTNSITKKISGGVTFSGSQVKSTAKQISAGLSFSGTFVKSTAKKFAAGALSFSGAITSGRLIQQVLASGLSFSGAMTRSTSKKHPNATLSFTGSQSRSTAKAMSSTLSFTGSQSRSIKTNLFAALSFAGNITKSTAKKISGGLSFSGALTSSRVVLVALAAALSFSGSVARNTGKTLSANLSFTGSSLLRSIGKRMSGSLSFSGAQSRSIATKLTAGVSFAATFTKRTVKNLPSATLSFSGGFTKRTGKALGGALSWLGNLVGVKTVAPNQFTALYSIGLSAIDYDSIVKVTRYVTGRIRAIGYNGTTRLKTGYRVAGSFVEYQIGVNMGLPVGGTAIITLKVSDQVGLQDPGAVLIAFRDPTGTKTGPTATGVVRDSAGNYHYNLALTRPGKWVARWSGTGVFSGASPDIIIDVDPSQLA